MDTIHRADTDLYHSSYSLSATTSLFFFVFVVFIFTHLIYEACIVPFYIKEIEKPVFWRDCERGEMVYVYL